MFEIILPETKPALEWINGRALQKVSPQRKHALAQGRFFAALDAWAQATAAGMVGTEWRFQIQPPNEERRPLVPDVAFLSYRRLPYEIQQVTDVPRVAPDAVVEVVSPDDRTVDIDEKIRVYLAAGTDVIFLVDPIGQVVTVRDPKGCRAIDAAGTIAHESLPGFQLVARNLFTLPRPK